MYFCIYISHQYQPSFKNLRGKKEEKRLEDQFYRFRRFRRSFGYTKERKNKTGTLAKERKRNAGELNITK
jgi:hypothetical protein